MSDQTAFNKSRTVATMNSGVSLLLGVCVVAVTLWQFPESARAEEPNPVENDFYRMVSFDVPKEIMLEAGGVELLPSGELAVATRRGEVWLVDKPLRIPPPTPRSADSLTGCTKCLGSFNVMVGCMPLSVAS